MVDRSTGGQIGPCLSNCLKLSLAFVVCLGGVHRYCAHKQMISADGGGLHHFPDSYGTDMAISLEFNDL